MPKYILLSYFGLLYMLSADVTAYKISHGNCIREFNDLAIKTRSRRGIYLDRNYFFITLWNIKVLFRVPSGNDTKDVTVTSQ